MPDSFDLPPSPGAFLDRTLLGGNADDQFASGNGKDSIDGGGGRDTVIFRGGITNYTIAKGTADGVAVFTVADKTGLDGTDSLKNVERLSFLDKKLALDLGITENAGQALLLLGTLLPGAIKSPSAVGTILGFFDAGATMKEIFQVALEIGFVRDLAGGSSHAALAAMVIRNFTGVEVADAATVDALVGYLDGRSANLSQADFLTILAPFPVNQEHINLVGLQQTGIEYL